VLARRGRGRVPTAVRLLALRSAETGGRKGEGCRGEGGVDASFSRAVTSWNKSRGEGGEKKKREQNRREAAIGIRPLTVSCLIQMCSSVPACRGRKKGRNYLRKGEEQLGLLFFSMSVTICTIPVQSRVRGEREREMYARRKGNQESRANHSPASLI